jgi:hypothetical protein
MKKVLSIMAALGIVGAAVQCYGGAAVLSNNYDQNGGLGQPVYYEVPGTLAPVADTWLQFTTVGDVPIGAAFKLSDPGFFDTGFIEIPGAADNTDVSFKLQAWKGSVGIIADITYAAAAAKVEATISQRAGANAGAPTPPNPAMLAMPTEFVIAVPEPSTVALVLLGGAVLLLRRRN